MLTSASTRDAPVEMTRSRLGEHVRSARVPMLLVRLPSGRALEVSEPMLALIGRSREEALSTCTPDYTHDPDATRASMQMLAAGALDGYTRRIVMPRPGTDGIALQVRVDACDDGGLNRLAIVTVLPASVQPTIPSANPGPPDASGRVVGTVGAEGTIERLVAHEAKAPAIEASALVGRPLADIVHPDDLGVITVLTAHASARTAAVTGRARVRANGGWRIARVALEPLARGAERTGRSAGFAFALVPESAAAPDPLQSVAAQGFGAPNPNQLQAASAAAHLALVATVMDGRRLSRLSAREREIAERILTGHRVAAIARELHLSESTVRNHLSSVYRKVGVASRVELLALLHADPSSD